MFVTKIRIAMTIVLMALTGSGICLTRNSLMEEGQDGPTPPALAQHTGSKQPDKGAGIDDDEKTSESAPFGIVHDFGEVQRGPQATHAFCFFNTSGIPLKVNSVRCSMGAITAWATKMEIQPGEEWKLEVSVDTRRFRGPRTQSVWLVTDNGQKMVTTVFHITADAQDAPTDASTGDADPLSAYARSEAFAANIAWHKQVGENEIRMSWFIRGEASAAMVCTADMSSYRVTTSLEVYDFAVQNIERRKLSHVQVLTLSKLVKSLPPSAKTPELKNLILVSVVEKGQPKTYLYNRLEAPRDIIRLYDLTGAFLDTEPVP
jgi:hypothetical protein